MALFTWPPPTTCGELPPEVCDPTDSVAVLKALRGTDPASLCERELVSDEHPSYPVIVADNLTEGRSGSVAHPLPLDRVQEYPGAGPIQTLVFRNAGGAMALWRPPLDCVDKKVTVGPDGFRLVDDQNSNVFDESCVGSIEDVDFIAGGVSFTDCEGATKMKLVFVPKVELCTFCAPYS